MAVHSPDWRSARIAELCSWAGSGYRQAMPQRKQTGLRLRDTIHRHSLRNSLIIGITFSYFLR